MDVLPYVSAVDSEGLLDVALGFVSQIIGQDVQYRIKKQHTTTSLLLL